MERLARLAAAAAILLHPGAMLPPCESFVTRQPSSATVRSRRRDGASRLRMSTAPTPSPEEDGGASPLDMDGLRERMRRQEDQYARLVAEQASYVEEEREVPESVHIVLFRPGTPEQHVHTIEIPMGSGNNVILAFEGGADCYSFARALQDLEFADPCPEETVFEPFRQYCEMSGMSLMIVPKGFELSPPQINANDDVDSEDGLGARDGNDDGVESITIIDDGDLDAWG